MNKLSRLPVIFLIVSILFSGCSSAGENSSAAQENKEYQQLAKKIDAITGSLSAAGTDGNTTDLKDESQVFENADNSQKTVIAMDMADDMALAQTLNIVTNDMLAMAGEAVKAYPHPILLNNYAAMLMGSGNINDALDFFQLSLNQEPDNVILLTNIANVFLEMEDFGQAEQYAKRALAAEEGFGPAYQVLTTIHLKNKDYILASETMIKSARHCFNSITMYHFDSFLNAVQALDPAEDDYPLEEEFIAELYDIAKENVDTKDVNNSIDTPKGQIKIKPFPQLTGPDNLLKSRSYLAEERQKISDKLGDTTARYEKYYNALDKHLYEPEETEDGLLPVKKNMRQVYTYYVVRSFYEYKIRQAEAKLNKAVEDLQLEREEKLTKISDEYLQKSEDAQQQAEKAQAELFSDMFSAFDEGGNPDPNKLYKASISNLDIQVENSEVELSASREYSRGIIDAAQECYVEIKQLIEEFWLRSGGILKYLNVEDVFNQLDIQRELMVYEHIWQPIGVLESEADFLFEKDSQLESRKNERQIILDSLSGAMAEYEQAVEKEKEEEKSSNKESLIPDIEKEAISEYQENNVLGDIGFSGSLFGLISGSIQYDGEKFGFDADTPFTGIGGERYYINGHLQKDVYYVTGAKIEGSTEWITDSKIISDSLQTSGNLGKAASKLGKIGFSFSNNTKTGEYITTDENNRIIDRGYIHIREKGGGIWKLGKSEQVIVKKSYMTGIATKKTTSKYQFDFATYSK